MPVYAVWKILRNQGVHLHVSVRGASARIKIFRLKQPISSVFTSIRHKMRSYYALRKLSIQALERKVGHILTDNGRVVRAYKSSCKRYSTLNLFAAFDVATDKIKGKLTEAKRHLDFQRFIDYLVSEYSSSQQLYVRNIGQLLYQ